MAKHRPGSVWSFRRPRSMFDSYVRTANPKALELVLVNTIPAESDAYDVVLKRGSSAGALPYTTIRIPRGEARLLARRILQCLEDTK